jgi:hypothetical protein
LSIVEKKHETRTPQTNSGDRYKEYFQTCLELSPYHAAFPTGNSQRG